MFPWKNLLMLGQPPPPNFDNWTPRRPGNTSASQRYTSRYYDCVHSPEPSPTRDIHQLPAVVGSQTEFSFDAQPNVGGTAARNVGGPPAQYTSREGRRPVLPPMREYEEDFDVPSYKGHLVLTVMVPRALGTSFSDEYLVAPIPLEQSVEGNYTSFKICFKRNPNIISTNDLLVAYGYINDTRLRRYFQEIQRETNLKRIWIVDPHLTTELLPSGPSQASTNMFMQNRTGLYLECRCGVHVYIGQRADSDYEWAHWWNLHFKLPTRDEP